MKVYKNHALPLPKEVEQIHLADKSAVFNTRPRIGREVTNLYEVAKQLMISRSLRHECRKFLYGG